MQQILLSQFSDDEVEIVCLPRSKFQEAYGATHSSLDKSGVASGKSLVEAEDDLFEKFADMNRRGHVHSMVMASGGNFVGERSKGSIRRKLSLSSIAHMWSK